MKELAGRLAALDPDAGAAVRVITYFDRLVEGRAGLEAMVRGAAVLAGCPARLADESRRVFVRVEAGGRRLDSGPSPDPAWPVAPLEPDGPPALWLERPGPPGVVEAMVLERASAAIRTVLDRTRGKAPAAPDQAMIELVLDASAPPDARLHAARRLGLDPEGSARAVALPGGRARVEAVTPGGSPDPPGGGGAGDGASPARGAMRGVSGRAEAGSAGLSGGGAEDGTSRSRGAVSGASGRAGVGPAVPVLELPSSWAAARTALRMTAEGTEQDPGPRVVHADRLGGLAVLAAAVGPGTEPVPDVRALDRATSAAPWMLATLDAVAFSGSLRAAATAINVHHSTLQGRLGQAEQLLGWSVHDPAGRLRLQLALVLRRLHHQF